MCIIASKNKNIDRLPTKEELTQCFNYNHDGAGFMYVNDNKVVIDKGYMELQDFLNRFDELCKKYNNFKNKALVIHCRIGTSSANSPENCHPYPISYNEKHLHFLHCSTNLGIVHNGIISDYAPYTQNSTTNDTQNFILQFLYPLYKHYRNFYKNKHFLNAIKKITNSKFVILDNKENCYYIGDFIDENGIKFSNTSYKPFISYYNNIKKFTPIKSKGTTTNMKYYDADAGLIYVNKSWFIEKGDEFYFATEYGKNDLIYDIYSMQLFELTENDELIKIDDDIIIYDEDWQEI